MASLLPLPVLSFLALPFMSSSTTSLNVAFFYMTWLTLTLSHPPLKVELYLLTAIRLVFYLLPAYLSLLFDTLVPSIAVHTKASGERALTGRLGSRKLARIAALSTANALGSVLLFVGIEWVLTEGLGKYGIVMRSGLQISKKLPAPWTVAKDVAKLAVIKGTLQYYLHRYALHSPKNSLPTRLHKSHFHSLTTPFPLSASYDHPLPYLLHHFIPTFLPSLLLRPHILTFSLHLALVSLSEAFIYSGYTSTLLPSAILLPGMARRCEAHVQSKGKGNFGSLGMLDWVHGTSVKGTRDVGDDAKEEFERRGGREKASGIADGVGDFAGRLRGGGKK